MVKVSIIVPVYNSEKSIENSINSVINQSLNDIEIICINDGSTDNSLNVLNKLSDKYDFIKVLNQENQGAAMSRNHGINHASGEYIAFLDSDDIFVDNDALELMYNVAIEYNANIVSSNIKMYNESGQFIDLPQYNDDLYWYFDENCVIDRDEYGIPFYFYKNIYKTSFLKSENIYFPNLIRGEDPVFLANIISKVDKIYGVSACLYAFLVSSTAKAFDKLTEYQIKYDYISQYKYCFDLFDKNGLFKTSKRYKRNFINYLKRVSDDKDIEAYDIVLKVFGKNNNYFNEFKYEFDSFKVTFILNKMDIAKSDDFFNQAKYDLLTINFNENPFISKDYHDKITKIINSINYDDYINYNGINGVSNKNRVMNYFLEKSNQFNYYKYNFHSLKKQNNKLKHEKNILSDDIKLLKKQLSYKSKELILNKIKNEQFKELNIAIKSPNPSNERHWGDYFFAIALKKSFEKKGFNVFIHEKDYWYSHNQKIDINVVLRGLDKYVPNDDEINLMWNIYVPEDMEYEEYDDYDIVFIASEKYAKFIKGKVNTMVKPLLQCTDPEIFHYEFDEECCEEILFVGVPRGIYREIIRDMMLTDYEVSIYGMGWEKYVDQKYIKGQFIPNDELHKYYSSCKILLNDHLDTMKKLDFPSNRFFDALACGAFVISDKIESAKTIFEGNIITYEDSDDLNQKLQYYLNHDEERKLIAEKGKEMVLKNHTFDIRVNTILNCLKFLFFNYE